MINVIIFFIINLVISAPAGDLVTEMPQDFPYDTKAHKMYSGYLSIKETSSKKLHYVFLESQNDPVNDPVVLWLNGGPGCSSLLGLGDENGPTYFEENTTNLKSNDYSWNKLANMIYLESPAGVGFSIAGKPEDYHTSDEISGKDNLSAITNFFELFPEYQKNDFYISGESYAGIYIPYLASNIIDYNFSTETHINLKGILVGNGVTDWNIDTEPAFMDFAYDHALYSYEKRQNYIKFCSADKTTATCRSIIADIESGLDGINIYDIYRNCYPPESVSLKGTNGQKAFNYTPWLFKNPFAKNPPIHQESFRFLGESNVSTKDTPPCADGKGDLTWYNRADVKKALHVVSTITWDLCSEEIGNNYNVGTKGSFFIYPKLIEKKLKIWKYSGDTDGAVPFNGTRQWIKNLNRALLKPTRNWRINNLIIAGFVEEYDGITFITVKGTGHMVPQWKRAEAFHMFQSFLKGTDI